MYKLIKQSQNGKVKRNSYPNFFEVCFYTAQHTKKAALDFR